MDKKDQQPKVSKNPKLGTDGLSKKERRALKVAAEGKTQVATNVKSNAGLKVEPSKQVVSNQGKEKTAKSDANIQAEKLADKTKVSESSNKAEEKAKRKAEHEARLALSKAKESQDDVSKADLRAQRRAVQEAQRIAKQKEQQDSKQTENKPPPALKKEVVKVVKQENKHKVLLFNHLFESSTFYKPQSRSITVTGVHSAFVQLGAQYESKTILGSNARCLALLSAMKDLIEDFTTPPKQEFCRSLEGALQHCVTYLQQCRPLAVSMMNALRHFKLFLTKVDTNLSDEHKRSRLLDCIEIYIQDEIAKAGEAISLQVISKISNDDIILIYGCSSLIKKILLDAHKEGKKFKVIVVDSRPLLEGVEMLRHLVLAGIQATYVLINAASFIMRRATKVLLGAHALLANGCVMSRTGTAQIALVAKAYNIPVLVCCETYKFCERVQTDSFVYNEIGNPDDVIYLNSEEKAICKNDANLAPLSLMYDVTPPDLVTAVVTELAILPCTSVPVILRIRPSEFI